MATKAILNNNCSKPDALVRDAMNAPEISVHGVR